MAFLLDTSVLVRLVNVSDPGFVIAERAVTELSRRGEVLHFAPQVAVEFRNVATRPTSLNGLGYTPAVADAQLAGFEALFTIIPESPEIYPVWKHIVSTAGVIGKQVHDARIAAVCQVNKVGLILTFNVRHFARFAQSIPLTAVDPSSISPNQP